MERKPLEIVPLAEELLIVELDDRLEMAIAVTDTNYGCNNSNCTQNGYCPVK